MANRLGYGMTTIAAAVGVSVGRNTAYGPVRSATAMRSKSRNLEHELKRTNSVAHGSPSIPWN
jgi:GMP synthase-like glutamine amidotransferase